MAMNGRVVKNFTGDLLKIATYKCWDGMSTTPRRVTKSFNLLSLRVFPYHKPYPCGLYRRVPPFQVPEMFGEISYCVLLWGK